MVKTILMDPRELHPKHGPLLARFVPIMKVFEDGRAATLPPITLVKIQDRYIIFDGHHRAAAAYRKCVSVAAAIAECADDLEQLGHQRDAEHARKYQFATTRTICEMDWERNGRMDMSEFMRKLQLQETVQQQ